MKTSLVSTTVLAISSLSQSSAGAVQDKPRRMRSRQSNYQQQQQNQLHDTHIGLAEEEDGVVKRRMQESMSMSMLCSFCPNGVDNPTAVLPVPGGETCEQASTFAAGLAASDPQCTVVLLAEGFCCPPKTIVEIAAGNEDFSTLVTAVTAAGLVDTLASDGPFTVFGK